MTDHLTRVAEAVRDACAAEAFMETTLAVEYVSAACPGEIISNMILNNIDLQAVIASVPRPEPAAWLFRHPAAGYLTVTDSGNATDDGVFPVYAEPVAAQVAVPDEIECSDAPWMSADTEPDIAYRNGWNACRAAMLAAVPEAPQTIQCNACNWIGSSADAHYLGGREPIGPLCPECHETTGPADGAATLRSAIRAMASMLQAREWAEHVSTDPDVTDLEVQITELVGTVTTLREQNATLVAALMPFAFICKEGVVIKNYVTVTTCAEYFNRAEKVLAALASAKGGAA